MHLKGTLPSRGTCLPRSHRCFAASLTQMATIRNNSGGGNVPLSAPFSQTPLQGIWPRPLVRRCMSVRTVPSSPPPLLLSSPRYLALREREDRMEAVWPEGRVQEIACIAGSDAGDKDAELK